MILSHTHKFIFICSSKVGTTSMEDVLRPLQEGEEYDRGIMPKHIPPALLRAALPEKVWDEYFKFVFVRNPWDWFISQWFYNSAKLAEARASSESGIRERTRSVLRRLGGHPPQPESSELVRVGDELRIEDVDAVFQLLKHFKGLPGRQGLYQSNWVYDMDDRMIVDYIGRYETLDDDFGEITRHLGLDLQLPRLNTTEHRDYRSYYSDETRERVGELWSVDVDNFGYAFDPPEGP
jgi:hypothetical protein